MARESALGPLLYQGPLMPKSANRIEVIKAALREKTGYSFSDGERLDRALTHSSARNQPAENYERLEFLGDRVLGLIVAVLLFETFPKADEGELSLRFNQLVDARTCSDVAIELDIVKLIRAGADLGNPAAKNLVNVRADVIEALIAAFYLDGGMDAAKDFIHANWKSRMEGTLEARRDAKTELQEWAHRDCAAQPAYVILSRDGPDHDPHFAVKVTVGIYPPETGEGRSKRLAEQDAATRFLVKRGVWQDAGIAHD